MDAWIGADCPALSIAGFEHPSDVQSGQSHVVFMRPAAFYGTGGTVARPSADRAGAADAEPPTPSSGLGCPSPYPGTDTCRNVLTNLLTPRPVREAPHEDRPRPLHVPRPAARREGPHGRRTRLSVHRVVPARRLHAVLPAPTGGRRACGRLEELTAQAQCSALLRTTSSTRRAPRPASTNTSTSAGRGGLGRLLRHTPGTELRRRRHRVRLRLGGTRQGILRVHAGPHRQGALPRNASDAPCPGGRKTAGARWERRAAERRQGEAAAIRPPGPGRSGTPLRRRAGRRGRPGRSSRTRCRTRGRGSRCRLRPWSRRRRRSRRDASR